jgi:protein-tyrosine phosphatase
MFDLHSHILPGIDDGATDVALSLEMAKIYSDQGVICVACTPHILPGVYHNTGPQICAAVEALQAALYSAGVDLQVVTGADNHVVPNFVEQIKNGHLLTIADTRYVLVEPPHHVAPPRLDELFFSILVADYVPILTHPERLSWIEDHYSLIVEMARRGVWMQVTSGALLGRFGKRPKYWAERMLADGIVHILASDAHNTNRRPPDLLRGHEIAQRLVGTVEANNLVVTRPQGILSNQLPAELPEILMCSEGFTVAGVSNAPSQNIASNDRGGFLGRMRNFFGN